MAKKKVAAIVKIQIEAGKATPAPPVGTALGPHGIAIMDFVKAYNAATESQAGTVVPTEITIYEDRTFDFILKTPPTPVLIRQKAGIEKASERPGTELGDLGSVEIQTGGAALAGGQGLGLGHDAERFQQGPAEAASGLHPPGQGQDGGGQGRGGQGEQQDDPEGIGHGSVLQLDHHGHVVAGLVHVAGLAMGLDGAEAVGGLG